MAEDFIASRPNYDALVDMVESNADGIKELEESVVIPDEFTIKRNPKSYIISVQAIGNQAGGTPVKIFIGPKQKYNSLSNKSNMLAFFTDDPITKSVKDTIATVTAIMEGKKVVPHANLAETANFANEAATAGYADDAGRAHSADVAGYATKSGHAETAGLANEAFHAGSANADGLSREISKTYITIEDADRIYLSKTDFNEHKEDLSNGEFVVRIAEFASLDKYGNDIYQAREDLKTGLIDGTIIVAKADTAAKAMNDGKGNNISDTYATNEALLNAINDLIAAIQNGDYVAGKAKGDEKGDRIIDTYVKKDELDDYVKKDELDELDDYVKKDALDDYAKKDELDAIAGSIKHSSYVTPEVKGTVTKIPWNVSTDFHMRAISMAVECRLADKNEGAPASYEWPLYLSMVFRPSISSMVACTVVPIQIQAINDAARHTPALATISATMSSSYITLAVEQFAVDGRQGSDPSGFSIVAVDQVAIHYR